MSEIILRAVMWQQWLALLPLVTTLVVMGLCCRIEHWPFWPGLFVGGSAFAVALPSCYVGLTGVAAALDIGSVYEDQFGAAVVLTIAQIIIGIILGSVLGKRPKPGGASCGSYEAGSL